MLNKKALIEKEFLKMEREYLRLCKECREQPWEEIPPFQRGWDVYVTLREDILNRDDGDFLLYLLKKYSRESFYIRKPDHIRLIRRGIYKVYTFLNYKTKLVPSRVKLSYNQYKELPDRERKYFRRMYKSLARSKDLYKLYFPRHWIKYIIKPHIITKRRVINSSLESEKDKLYNKLSRSTYWNRDSRHYNWAKYYNRSKFKKEAIKIIKDEIGNNW